MALGLCQKSIRIKTKKKRLFEGMRSFNVIAPKFKSQINNYLSYRLADRMGLMTPYHRLVTLWSMEKTVEFTCWPNSSMSRLFGDTKGCPETSIEASW